MKASLTIETPMSNLYVIQQKNYIEERREYQRSWQREFRRIVEDEYDSTDIFMGHLHCGSGKGYLIRELSHKNHVIVTCLGKHTKSDLEPNLEKDLLNNKDQITRLLEEELIFHKVNTSGLYQFQLPKDPNIVKALELLNNEEYKNILIGPAQ